MKLTIVNPVRLACIVGGAIVCFAVGGEAIGWVFLLGALVGSIKVN